MHNKVKEWFYNNYPSIIEDLKNTDHHHSNGSLNPFHLEGDCHTHTMMVYDLIEGENPELYFAALLHDLGKISTRYEKDSGRVSFRDHENLSTVKSIDILKAASKEFNIDIVKVLQMIAWHGELWTKKDVDRQEYLKKINDKFGFSKEFYDDFVHFVKADALGRTMEDEDEILNIMEQMEFLENYIPFNSSEYFKHTPTKEVIFMVGISGSGKSTEVEKYKGLRVISTDNYLAKGKLDYNSVDYAKNIKKAHDNSIRDIKDAVQKEENVIIDMTNLTKEQRRKKLSLFPTTKYLHRAVVFLNGEESIKRNLAKRPDKTIPQSVIERQMREFEFPGYDEFSKIEFIL
jgi:predicted kinase